MNHLRVVFLLSFLFIACGCESYDYYFTVKDKKEHTGLLLHSDDQITVFYMVYNGFISRFSIDVKKEFKDTDIEVTNYEHYLLLPDGKKLVPLIINDQSVGKIHFNENNSSTIASKYVFEKKPKSLIEVIKADIVIDGRIVPISEELPLIKDSYSRLEALWDI